MKIIKLKHGEILPTWPEQYLAVEQCATGEVDIVPLRGNATLDIKRQIKRWIKATYGGGWHLEGNLISRIEGELYAQLVTDARPYPSVVVWASGGFYVSDDGTH